MNKHCVKLLLSNGADVNQVSKSYIKETPLHVFIQANFRSEKLSDNIILDTLISAGANLNLCNMSGETPLMTAVLSWNKKLPKIYCKLIDSGTNVNIPKRNWRNCLA